MVTTRIPSKRSHGPVKSEKVRVMRRNGSLVKLSGIGDEHNTWLAKDDRITKKLSDDLVNVNSLTLLFETFPTGGEAYQVLKWDRKVIEKVHYDDCEDVHVDNL
jgi:hypothetical protein